MKNNVLVLMSGGVDSSVAAYLLKEKGFNVSGVTMVLFSQKTHNTNVAMAKKVAGQLGIKHYIADKSAAFKKNVIEYFVSEYFKGRTPNPCVMCNPKIKFGEMLKFAKKLGCDYIATGHYAIIEKAKSSSRYILKKGIDGTKDQSYFLYRLNPEIFPRILFPLGKYKKSEVKKIAEKLGLKSAQREESQEICFVENKKYGDFIKKSRGGKIRPGKISDATGKILGRHTGIPFYTVGQRRGLNISAGVPVYVAKIDVRENRIVVGKKDDILQKEFDVKKINWLVPQVGRSLTTAKVRIRYKHREEKAKIYLSGKSSARVVFEKPQWAITPGQSAVFYKNNVVLGGGIIY